MSYLADTNILLRLTEKSDPQHVLVKRAITALHDAGEKVFYTLQNLTEFWNVCTRPATARKGLGLSIEETDKRALIIERYFTLLPAGDEAVHAVWRQLVVAHRVSGVQVHDARLVAAMRVHGISHILTFNGKDFERYPRITAVNPRNIETV